LGAFLPILHFAARRRGKKLHPKRMEFPYGQPGHQLDKDTLQGLANSVETIINIFYLIEVYRDHPEQIDYLVSIGAPALRSLVDFVHSEPTDHRSKANT
jgi:hypothetical protein